MNYVSLSKNSALKRFKITKNNIYKMSDINTETASGASGYSECCGVGIPKRTLRSRFTEWMRKQKIKYEQKKRHIYKALITHFLEEISEDSEIAGYAKLELDILNKDSVEKYDTWMRDDLMDIIRLISSQGDSGFSIKHKMTMLNKLIEWKPLSKLTFSDDEFGKPFDWSDTRQNKRASSVFHDSYGYQYLNSFKNRVTWKVEESADGLEIDIKEKEFKHIYSGQIAILTNDGKIRPLRRVNIKNFDKFNFKEFIINTYDVRIGSGNNMYLCLENDVKDLLREYEEIEVGSKSYISEMLDKLSKTERKSLNRAIIAIKKHAKELSKQ